METIQTEINKKDFDVKKMINKYNPKFEGTKKLYGIKDVKEGFIEVFIQPNDLVALRNFSMAPKKSGTMINQYPEDFELWKIAEINSNSGEISSDVKKLANAADYVGEK